MQPTKKVSRRRAPLTWFIFSREKFTKFVTEARETQRYPKADLDHLGELLRLFVSSTTHVRRVPAFKERSARLFASNGGSSSSFQLARENGQIEFRFMSARTYIAAEAAVMNEWAQQPNPDLNPDVTRLLIWDREAVGQQPHVMKRVRLTLSSDFKVPGSSGHVPVQGSFRFIGQSSKRSYKIVDLDEYHGLGEDREDSRTAGKLLQEATTLGEFLGATPLLAVDAFRLHVAHGMYRTLEPGRFAAFPLALWKRAIECSTLPSTPTANRVRAFFIHQRKMEKQREREERLQLKELRKCDPWGLISHRTRPPKSKVHRPLREPGEEPWMQLNLPIYSERDLLQFPPKANQYKPFVRLTKRAKEWSPIQSDVHEFGPQLEIEFNRFQLTPPIERPSRVRPRVDRHLKKTRPRDPGPTQGKLF